MKYLLMAAAVSTTLLMGGCTTQIDLAKVQEATVAACGFLPTAIQVTEWAQVNNPYVTTAGQIATVICDAVMRPRAVRRMAGPVSIEVRLPDGSRAIIQGRFVR